MFREVNLYQVVFRLPQSVALDPLLKGAVLVGSGPQVDWLWGAQVRLRHDSVMGDQWKLYGHREVTPTGFGSHVHFRYILVGHGVEVLEALEFLLGEPEVRRKQRQLYFDGPKTQLHVDYRDNELPTLSIETHDGSLKHLAWRDRLLAQGLEELNGHD